MATAGEGHFLFLSDLNPTGHLKTLKCVWQRTLRRAGVSYFRIYDLQSRMLPAYVLAVSQTSG